MVQERHIVAEESESGRIILMDSITHANEQYGPDDVLIGGSWMGVVPVSFAARFRPRAVICNDAGVGAEGGGINALYYLDGIGIPGAAVAAESAEIANGLSHWETGVISYVNHWALACGCKCGMSVRSAARALLGWSKAVMYAAPGREARHVVYRDSNGEIVTVDSIKFVQPDDGGKVVVIGSHGGVTSCGYAVPIRPRALITSDGSGGRDGAGTRGLALLANNGIPGVAVSVHSAAIGDGLGIYERGILSTVNRMAEEIGARPGMRARDAALLLLGARD
jgi:hypothetical protein